VNEACTATVREVAGKGLRLCFWQWYDRRPLPEMCDSGRELLRRRCAVKRSMITLPSHGQKFVFLGGGGASPIRKRHWFKVDWKIIECLLMERLEETAHMAVRYLALFWTAISIAELFWWCRTFRTHKHVIPFLGIGVPSYGRHEQTGVTRDAKLTLNSSCLLCVRRPRCTTWTHDGQVFFVCGSPRFFHPKLLKIRGTGGVN